MQERRYRRGRGHGIGQPGVQRRLRGLRERTQSHEHDDGWRQRVTKQHGSLGQDVRDAQRAGGRAEQHDARQQAQASRHGDQQPLLRRTPRRRLLRLVADQQERRQAGELPEHQQRDEVIGQHGAQHGAHEQREEGEESRQVGRPAQVARGVQVDVGADAGDEQREQQRQAIEAQRQAHAQAGNPRVLLQDHLAPSDLGPPREKCQKQRRWHQRKRMSHASAHECRRHESRGEG